VLLLLTQDDVGVACQVTERVAMDRAVAEIDEALVQAYDVRHLHLEVSFSQ
jgi:CCR4-NOT transcription complex subunit 1